MGSLPRGRLVYRLQAAGTCLTANRLDGLEGPSYNESALHQCIKATSRYASGKESLVYQPVALIATRRVSFEVSQLGLKGRYIPSRGC